MRQKKDYSMLYGVLAGFAVFILVAGWFIIHIDRGNHVHVPIEHLFPEGTQVIEESDSHEFRDGTALAAVQIPPEASENFAQNLRRQNFVETPIAEDVQWTLTGVSEAEASLKVTNGLWYFSDDTPEQFRGEQYHNYTFMMYDLDTAICYYIEYDS